MGISDIVNSINSVQNDLNGSTPLNQSSAASYQANGFLVAATPQADGNGLPYTKIIPNQDSQFKRSVISWFVPQFGVVNMSINPQNINYAYKKLITKDRTKGGYTIQYWGEELPHLMISGTTGSTGIEGINALQEVYRAEQYAFDAVGLSLAANNANSDLTNNLVQGLGGTAGNLIGGLIAPTAQSGNGTAAAVGGGILGGILGLNSPNNNLTARNITSLAQLAAGVEMFYNGIIYRGFFEDMSVVESATDFCMQYTINFTVTQTRGYRTNQFAFQKSPNSGPISPNNQPWSFSGKLSNQ
jgi:hypothetical protein